MAFGLSPKHIQEYRLNDIVGDSFLVLAIEAATKLGWEISFLDDSGFGSHVLLHK